MKIVFINRYFYPDLSATSQILSDLVFHLSLNGLETHVVTSRQKYEDPKANLPKSETIQGARVHRIWSSTFGRTRLLGRVWDYLTFSASASIFLMRSLKKEDTVIPMTDPPLISVISAGAAKCRRSRLVQWIQDLFPETAVVLKVKGAGGIVNYFLKRSRNWSLRVARLNVVIGHRMAERLIAEKIKPDRIRVIANWADGNHIVPLAKEANPLVREWGLENKFVAAYSGNMGRAHEFQTLIDTAKKLRDEERLLFLFIGGGPEKTKTEVEFRRLDIQNALFKPYQPYSALRESLGVADLHVVSLRPGLEGCVLPSKFYGALAAGKPVIYIGDPSGDIGEVLIRERCGYVIGPGDSEAFADRLKILMGDQRLLEEMGKNARTVFDRQFDKHFGLEEWQKILK